jgi:hypothetical protein
MELTGGMVSLAKYLRNDLDYYFLKPEAIFKHALSSKFFDDFMYTKIGLDHIAKSLPDKIRLALVKMINNEKLGKDESRKLQDYLIKTGAADTNGEIRSKLISAYFNHSLPEQTIESLVVSKQAESQSGILTITDNINVDKISGEIYFGAQKSEDYLSESELEFITYLAKNRGERVQRDVLATVIWPEHKAGYYSDWAIDKLASRVRTKLKDVKPYRIIKTVRNYGFKLS